MNFKILKVETANERVVVWTLVNGESIPLTVVNDKLTRTDLRPGQSVWFNLDQISYQALNRQIRAIIASRARPEIRPEKISANKMALAKAMAEADHINKLAEDYQKRHNCNWSSAVWEVVKAQNHQVIPVESGWGQNSQEWHNALRKLGIKIAEEGWLLVPRSRSQGDDGRIMQKVAGINSAIRMQDHILAKYTETPAGELPKLQYIEQVVKEANCLLARWKISGRDRRNYIEKKITQVVLELDNCRNDYKIAARDQLDNVISLEDRRGRINPGAKAAQTVSALDNLRKRFEEVGLIMPIIALRREALIFEKRRLEKRIQTALSQLKKVMNFLNFFNGSTQAKTQTTVREINKVLYLFNSVIISPYREQADQASYFLACAKVKLANGKAGGEFFSVLAEAEKILRSDMAQFG